MSKHENKIILFLDLIYSYYASSPLLQHLNYIAANLLIRFCSIIGDAYEDAEEETFWVSKWASISPN